MNILVVCQYYHPEQFLINEVAPELAKRGHGVTVLTGLPNYPEGIVPDEYKHNRRRHEFIDGVEVIRCHEVGRAGGKINLLRNYISFAYSATRAAKKLGDRFDVVLCYQLSPITMLAPAVAYKKKYHKPLINYCLDIWPESAQAHIPNKGPFKLLYNLIGRYSKKMYQACDHIAVTSKPFISYLSEKANIPADRMSYLPQHSNGEMLPENLASEDNGIADFMFAGNLGKGQKLEIIIEAARQLKQKTDKFKIHIVGDGSMRQQLEELTGRFNLAGDIVFYGRKSKNEMPQYYKLADALLITLRGNNFVGNTMPGKLQTYMTTGKPIFGAINGAAQQVIKDANCGACVPAEDATGLAGIMYDYIAQPEKYENCGMNGKRFFQENFTMDVFIKKLERKMEDIATK